MPNLFHLCQKFLLLIGRATRLSYIEISVIFNLWIQGGVLVLSALAPITVLLFKHGAEARPLLTVGLAAYAFLYVVLYILMLAHYRLPFKGAFYRCVDDLDDLAERLHISYELVNILLFVVLFLLLLGMNIWLAVAVS